MNKKVFVAAATGFQGGAIASSLIEQGYSIRTLARKKETNDFEREGIEVHIGDWADAHDLSNALKDVKAAVYTFPLIFELEKAISYTQNFIQSCEKNAVDLVVFNTGFDLPKEKTGLLALDLKLEIKALFDASNLKVITLMPDVYIDNLAAPWSIPVILEHGILPYPIPTQTKIPWLSHVDLANYVVAALQRPELAGETLAIGGNLWTGEEIAAAIGKKINKEIKFVGLPADDFEQQLLPAFGAVPAKEISNLYRYLRKNYEQIIVKDFAQTQVLLSVRPQTLTEWVAFINWAG